MKMKKLILFLVLVFAGVATTFAQKTTYKFRDAQSRAGDAITEVCVKPTVVEVKLLNAPGKNSPERQTYKCELSKEEAEIAMKGDLVNIRAWASYMANEEFKSDVIMAATYKVESNNNGGYTVWVVGYPAVFDKWYTATKDDYEWIRIQKLAPSDNKAMVAPVVKTSN